MDVGTLETLKDEYPTSSWALWSSDFPEDGCIEQTPAEFYEFIERNRDRLRPSIVLLSLNPSTQLPSDYQNFHSTNPKHRNLNSLKLGDAAFDMLAWHDDLIEEGVVAIAPYNERNTDEPYDIEYRIEQRIKEHSETVRVRSKQIEETYKQRSQVERTIGVCKNCGLETPGVRGRVRVKSQVFLTLCLRLVIVIANYERGANPGKTTIEVCQ